MIIYNDNYFQEIDFAINKNIVLKSLKNQTIFITGASGLIGSTVADVLLLLNRNYGANLKLILAGRDKNRIKQRFYAFKDGEDYVFYQYDATKEIEIPNCNFVIHGASNADPIAFSKFPVETMTANFLGLNNILKSCIDKKTKVVYISSSEVYGQKNNNLPFNEDDFGFVDILNPRACYPSSKRASETLCSSYYAEYGVECVIVRPGHIYGPQITESDSRASSQFMRKASAKENIVMKSAGSQLRSYCHSVDCATAILTVMLNGILSTAYNISNKNSIVNIRTLAECMAKVFGVDIVFENPSDIEKRGYNLMENSSLNATELEKLNWNAVFDLQKGVENCFKFFRC